MSEHWEIVASGHVTSPNSARELWERAVEYFKWCEENPINIKRTITSGRTAGAKMDVQYTRPYSIKGICIHCGIFEEYFRDIRQTKNKLSEYYIVASKILYLIYVQNLEMATIGVFNPIFTAKVLNIEKDEVPSGSIKVEIVNGLPTLATSEDEILEKLEAENPEWENPKEQNS